MDSIGKRLFVVTLKPKGAGKFSIAAERLEVHGEHIVLLNPGGNLAGLFLARAIESLIELPGMAAPDQALTL
jgi:hypothetical protein